MLLVKAKPDDAPAVIAMTSGTLLTGTLLTFGSPQQSWQAITSTESGLDLGWFEPQLTPSVVRVQAHRQRELLLRALDPIEHELELDDVSLDVNVLRASRKRKADELETEIRDGWRQKSRLLHLPAHVWVELDSGESVQYVPATPVHKVPMPESLVSPWHGRYRRRSPTHVVGLFADGAAVYFRRNISGLLDTLQADLLGKPIARLDEDLRTSLKSDLFLTATGRLWSPLPEVKHSPARVTPAPPFYRSEWITGRRIYRLDFRLDVALDLVELMFDGQQWVLHQPWPEPKPLPRGMMFDEVKFCVADDGKRLIFVTKCLHLGLVAGLDRDDPLVTTHTTKYALPDAPVGIFWREMFVVVIMPHQVLVSDIGLKTAWLGDWEHDVLAAVFCGDRVLMLTHGAEYRIDQDPSMDLAWRARAQTILL
jgi:hypothetical protein